MLFVLVHGGAPIGSLRQVAVIMVITVLKMQVLRCFGRRHRAKLAVISITARFFKIA